MLIDVLSDTHLDEYPKGYMNFFKEFRDNRVLLLAGDITKDLVQLDDFLEKASRVYRTVVYVDGNHEHRNNKSVLENSIQLNRICKHTDLDVVYLDGLYSNMFVLDDIAFIGGNGWYDWRAFDQRGSTFKDAFSSWDDHSKDALLDFGLYEWPNILGYEQVSKMAKSFEKANADPAISKIVMITHTCPHEAGLFYDPNDLANNAMAASYANTELGKIFDLNTNNKLKLWAYGHTHNRMQWDHKGVKMVNNFYGYPWDDHKSWKMVTVTI